MEEIKILWLYSKLLDLYGDSGNIRIIEFYLRANAIPYTIDQRGLNDDIDFSGYRLVYIGPGKGRNLAVAAAHFVNYGDRIKAAVEAGTLFFVTGNARLLFGKRFTVENQAYNGIGLFPYQGTDNGEVFISDVIVRDVDNNRESYYGFINRTAYIEPYTNSCPWFCVEKVTGDLKGDSDYEGNHYHNYLGTWLLGPLLVKNPELLRKILRLITQEDLIIDNELEQQAYNATMREFKK